MIVKNLCDPIKVQDPKYRQLKFDNDKVRTKIMACAAAIPLLHSLGFVETVTNCDASLRVLRIEESVVVDSTVMTSILQEITSTLTQLDQGNMQNKIPKLDANNASTSTSTSSTTTSKLSEKQKARRLLEEKEQKERELAKAQRKQNVALLKQDKYVRQNDENWTSGVSAACAKTGDCISTFRDKYGE